MKNAMKYLRSNNETAISHDEFVADADVLEHAVLLARGLHSTTVDHSCKSR